MVKSLTKLFNYILSNGTWPSLWKKSYIVPIHKSGDYKDPNNYRGIAVSSCLSKVLTKIMEIRLQDYMIDNKLWNKNQCGFMKGHRTEDNVFILKSLFHKYVKKKQEKIYVAFIDFRKFFDSLNRQYLMYKLIQHGITGKFYYLIKTMYQDTFYNVKTYCGFSKIFKSNSGVKQGCNLSPILANIYQNDLHNLFNGTCEPVCIKDITFNSLSFADDLVLLSRSEKGLQNCLNHMNSYCYKWDLSVNEIKSKVMVLSKIIKKVNVTFGDVNLEVVSKYKYLGVILCANGKIQKAINDRICKANRALFLLKQMLSSGRGNISPKLSLSMFDKQIMPILLYGCTL